MPFGVHPGFLIVLLIIVLIVFGPGKLPELGSAVGRGIREFRKESDKVINEVRSEGGEQKPAAASTTVEEPAVTSTVTTAPSGTAGAESAKTETKKPA